jgi:DNA/RNA endonuclease YhcR with UshA esterase domain
MRIVASLIAGLAALLASAGALSHHSFSAEFDVGRPVTLEGTVKEMEWTNPHAWIHLIVQDDQGNAQEWAVELLGVNSLIRSGMSPKTVVPGDRLTITGFGARNGTNTANASTVNRTGTDESLWTSVRE